MGLSHVEPKTSKITGNVILDIYGLNFNSNELKINTDNIVDICSSAASISKMAAGIKLMLPAVTGQKAGFMLGEVFNSVFDIDVSFTKGPRTMHGVTKTRLVGIDCLSERNISSKVRVFAEYIQEKGFLLVVETVEYGQIKHREERFFDVSDIQSLRVVACGKYIHGYCKTQNNYLHFGKSLALNESEYRVAIFSETPDFGVAVENEVLISKILFNKTVAFAGYPTEIVSWEDRAIRVKTTQGEISLGDLIVGLWNGENYKLENAVRYVAGGSVSSFSKRFDTIQAIYEECVNPSREKLFKNTKGFHWDDGFLLSDDQKNNNLGLPTLWDPSTGNIPRSFFQSGVGPSDALKFSGIEKNVSEDTEKWYAKIQHGTYFVANVPYFLFSDQSITEYLGVLTTTDGRSYHPLLYRPKIGIPITATSLGEDPESKRVIERKRLQKRGRFTGRVVNGVELNSSDVKNIDKTKEEFIVRYNSNNEIVNWKIPTDGVAAGKYVFSLPQKPIKEFKIRFSRKDIFKTEKIIAKKYGEDVYDSFQYGEGVEDVGDYAIDYKKGLIEVVLERPFTDLGTLSYVFDYPAIIEFNKNYTEDKGTWITRPTYSDLKTLDKIGISNGCAGQKMRLYDFPIMDDSSYLIADNSNFKLFIYDEFDNSFDTEWRRVKSLKSYGPLDKVFVVDSFNGFVSFGDGVNGLIPSKYLNVLTAYKPTLKIQFEPDSACDYWVGKTIDLNLTKQNLSSGFLFISRKKLIPSKLEVEFGTKSISAFETAEFKVAVYTQEGEVVSGVEVNFESMTKSGKFREESLITNPNGEVSTIFTPSGKLEDMGIKVDLFQSSVDSSTPGIQITSAFGSENGIPYMSLEAAEAINGDLNEIYLFKILDDGDQFLPYNNTTRRGGRLVALHDENGLIKGSYLAGSVIGFNKQLPQPFDPDAPNYEPNLRGFYIIGRKTIQARAYIDVDENRIYSDLVSILVEYSPLQKGIWKLPTPPIDYEASQIDTATYIQI